MRIAVFSLTGFANEILPALASIDMAPDIFVTRAEPGPFPHYDCENAMALAARLGIPSSDSAASEDLARGADLLLVATYHRKIPARIYATCRHSINLHPSLLPKYPGRDPYAAVLENGESETGLTAHQLTDVMDAGAVYGQWTLPIPPGETNGALRKRLAELAAKATIELVRRISSL
jgi:methionyl-tRNA formyltransferase